ncbi:larval cuticle protein LCP-14-like [Anticarsia gemmatalis]|uniref:larval cuticle protein LCP-14-like n=1 Tax=Anticarsia gemmatalis TaxID=129554 RepID=UPI003F771BA6
MKSAIVALCIVACAFAASDKDSAVVRNDYQQSPEGNYQFSYETENGIYGRAEGKVVNYGKDEVALEVIGSNQYKSPEGQLIELTYVAGPNGYEAQGAHLPTTPAPLPIPDYILRSLEYIAAHPYVEKKL